MRLGSEQERRVEAFDSAGLTHTLGTQPAAVASGAVTAGGGDAALREPDAEHETRSALGLAVVVVEAERLDVTAPG